MKLTQPIDLHELNERFDAVVKQVESDRVRASLFEISLAVTALTGNSQRVFDLILTAAIDQHNIAETGSFFTLDKTNKKVVLTSKRGEQEFVQFSEFAVGEGFAGTAAARGATVVSNNCGPDERYVPYTAEGVAQLRSIVATPVVSSGTRELLGVLCVHNSARDKEFTPSEVEFVEGLALIAGLALSNEREFGRVIQSSQYDRFTGLLNRQAIEVFAEELVGNAHLAQRPCSLLFIDIDGLKHLNDTYSMKVGDQAILAVAAAIQTTTHPNQTRAGKWKEGDEFVLVLPGTELSEAVVVAQRIREQLQATKLEGVAPQDETVHISIGVAEVGPAATTATQVSELAEERKRLAKLAGGDRIVAADDSNEEQQP